MILVIAKNSLNDLLTLNLKLFAVENDESNYGNY